MTTEAARLTGGTSSPLVVRLGVPLLAVAAIVLAGALAVSAHRIAGMWIASDGPLPLTLAVAAGVGLTAAGLDSWSRGRRGTAVALLATALAWFLSGWAYPTIGSSPLFTAGLALGGLYPAVALHALLAGPTGRLSDVDRRLVVTGYVILGLLGGLVPALTFDASRALCALCPGDLVAFAPSEAVATAAGRAADLATSGWAAVSIGALVVRTATLGPASLRTRGPARAAVAVLLGLVGLDALRSATGPVPPTDPLTHALVGAEAAALTAFAGAIGLEHLLARRSRRRIAAVVADLLAAPASGGLRDALAAMLGDPGLRLAYPLASGALVDAAGRPLELSQTNGRSATSIVRDGRVVAVVEHRSDVLDDPRLVDEVAAAARLGLEHERLQAASRAQLAELREARGRIVEAGDNARRRLERDLHDGAQQRLLALSLTLRLLHEADARSAAAIEDAILEVREALAELRAISHGLFPALLGDEGLAAAIAGLAEGSTVPVTLASLPPGRMNRRAEMAAYHVVAEAVRAATGPVHVDVAATDQLLRVAVEGVDLPADVLLEVADRVGAADGEVAVERSAGGPAFLRATIPCVS
jgi:signal transduction histidine kinase